MPPTATPNRHQLAQRITTLRQHHGLTVRACAHAAGYSIGTWQGWERGRSQPRPASLEAIARALGVPVAALLVPDGWRCLELRLQPGTVEAIRQGGRAEAERVAALYASGLPDLLLQAVRIPAKPPHADGRGRRRRTRAEVLAGIAEANRMRADRAAQAGVGPGGGGSAAERPTLHGVEVDHLGRGGLSTLSSVEDVGALTAEG